MRPVCPWPICRSPKRCWLLLPLFNHTIGFRSLQKPTHSGCEFRSSPVRCLFLLFLSAIRPYEAYVDVLDVLFAHRKPNDGNSKNWNTSRTVHGRALKMTLIDFIRRRCEKRETKKSRASERSEIRRNRVRSVRRLVIPWWYMCERETCVYNTTAECRLSIAVACAYEEWRCLCVRSQFPFRLPWKWSDSRPRNRTESECKRLLMVRVWELMAHWECPDAIPVPAQSRSRHTD